MESTIVGYISGFCKGASTHHSQSPSTSPRSTPPTYTGVIRLFRESGLLTDISPMVENQMKKRKLKCKLDFDRGGS